MSARPARIDRLSGSARLFSSGQVRWARAVSRRAPAEWGYEEVAGRFVELVGRGAGANLTIAAGLVRDAQRAREPVAWVAPPASTFHPPDLADWGVDIAAVAVIRPPDEARALRAVDELLRSGAFGLVVLDGVEPRAMPMAVQVRLANLAQQQDAAWICLCKDGGDMSGSLASLRAVTFRRRLSAVEVTRLGAAGADQVPAGPGAREGAIDEGVVCFEYGFEVTKDKRRGRRWTWSGVCEGAPGQR